jgi:opacity protein-like surface antigen
MKRISIVICAAALSCLGSAAQAQNWYASGLGGANYTLDGSINNERSDFDLGYAVGGSLGYKLTKALWVEGEISYRKNGIDQIGAAPSGADFVSWAFMANALYQFDINYSLKPHVGGGVGIVRGTLDFGNVRYDDEEVGVQFIVGVDYNLSPGLAIVVDYRYLTTGDFSFGLPGYANAEYSNSTFLAGLRKTF